jgi:hypothetical protein
MLADVLAEPGTQECPRSRGGQLDSARALGCVPGPSLVATCSRRGEHAVGRQTPLRVSPQTGYRTGCRQGRDVPTVARGAAAAPDAPKTVARCMPIVLSEPCAPEGPRSGLSPPDLPHRSCTRDAVAGVSRKSCSRKRQRAQARMTRQRHNCLGSLRPDFPEHRQPEGHVAESAGEPALMLRAARRTRRAAPGGC